MSRFNMELRTTPSYYEPFVHLDTPYDRILAVGTPDGLVACSYITEVATPLTTHHVPATEEFATALGDLLQRYVGDYNPETDDYETVAPYWCHNILELLPEEDGPMGHQIAKELARTYSRTYVHHEPDEALPLGTPGVVRDLKQWRNVHHTFIALGEPFDGTEPQCVSIFNNSGNVGVMSLGQTLESYRFKEHPAELAAPPLPAIEY
ncbi:MAG TPA: hypothetical protein VJP80_06035 [Candidatus Saccharimonadales bacterium]|nr:hypothetical protein [Candidatus Saccharimonadales bacterium]